MTTSPIDEAIGLTLGDLERDTGRIWEIDTLVRSVASTPPRAGVVGNRTVRYVVGLAPANQKSDALQGHTFGILGEGQTIGHAVAMAALHARERSRRRTAV